MWFQVSVGLVLLSVQHLAVDSWRDCTVPRKTADHLGMTSLGTLNPDDRMDGLVVMPVVSLVGTGRSLVPVQLQMVYSGGSLGLTFGQVRGWEHVQLLCWAWLELEPSLAWMLVVLEECRSYVCGV